jgi:putative lipoic acid-binding regulatory protein
MKKTIEYPAEITFKSVFKNNPEISDIIEALLAEHGVAGRITFRESRRNKFVSYTIIAEFESESSLNEICVRISTLEGFIMLF